MVHKMTTVKYEGFKLGVQCADSIALSVNANTPSGRDTLHVLKNLCARLRQMEMNHGFAVNNVTHWVW